MRTDGEGCESEREASREAEPANTSIWDFQPPGLRPFVTTALEDAYRRSVGRVTTPTARGKRCSPEIKGVARNFAEEAPGMVDGWNSQRKMGTSRGKKSFWKKAKLPGGKGQKLWKAARCPLW